MSSAKRYHRRSIYAVRVSVLRLWIITRGGFEDGFWMSGLSAITDPNAAIVTDEHVPSLKSKTENRIRVGCAIVLHEKLIDSIGIDEIKQ